MASRGTALAFVLTLTLIFQGEGLVQVGRPRRRQHLLRLVRGRRLASGQQVEAYWGEEDASPLGRRLNRILELCPSLQRPMYSPPTFARTSKANFLFATLRSRLGALRRNVEPPLMNRTLTCSSEPDITIEWAKDEVGTVLPANAPIAIFLHTITGTAAQTRWLTSYASSRGWRSCVLVRRGHGASLTSPKFNLLGAIDDVHVQLEMVRKAYPRAAFMGMVGISAGSAQLINYLGRVGASTPVGAASAICPAWDTRLAFEILSKRQPRIDRAMVKNIKSRLILRNRKVLRAWCPEAFEACIAASTLPELLDAHAPFAMSSREATAAEYLREHDPMAVRRGVKVPLLLLNAEDDFVCPASLARPEVVTAQPGCLLLVTRYGSHVAFNEGRLGLGSFHGRVSFDFLDAAFAAAREEKQEGDARPPRGVSELSNADDSLVRSSEARAVPLGLGLGDSLGVVVPVRPSIPTSKQVHINEQHSSSGTPST